MALPGGAKWVERTTPEAVIEKMMAERRKLDRETRLTWNPNKPPMAPLDRMIGDVNLSLAYIKIPGERPGQNFYIQNARFFRSNGRETTIEEIRAEGVSDITIHYLLEAYKNFMKDAQQRDPALCTLCGTFRAESYDDYTTHIIQKHPASTMERLDSTPADEPAPVKIEEKKEAEPLTCCGKSFKNAQAVRAHQRFGHKAG